MLFSLRYSLNKGKGFHVAVVLLSNGSQNTPKCGKNITDTLACDSCATFFLVFCSILTSTLILLVDKPTAR